MIDKFLLFLLRFLIYELVHNKQSQHVRLLSQTDGTTIIFHLFFFEEIHLVCIFVDVMRSVT